MAQLEVEVKDIASRMNDLNSDIQITMARMEMALDLLRDWLHEHPDGHLAIRSRNLIKRCES